VSRGEGEGRGEAARKWVHLLAGLFALLLRDLTPLEAAGCAAGAVLFNRFVLAPLGGGLLFRRGERGDPWRSGIVLYPAAVLALILLFHEHLEIAAAAWVIMAAGDSAAGALGRVFGRHPLPWNPRKTAEGTAAFTLAAGAAATGILFWMGRDAWEAFLLAAPTAACAAGVESLPWRLDDNLTVPLLSGLFLRGLVELDPGHLAAAAPTLREAFLMGVLVNLVLSLLALRSGSVDRSGAVAGFLVGLLTFTFSGWRGFLVLLAFFVLGSAATRAGYRRKARAGVAQAHRGARSARHALANCAVAVYLAFLSSSAPAPGLFVLAFVCAYATAAFDTVSSEVGQAYGGRPVLITTLRVVPVGTDGAISWVGTLAGLAAALSITGVARATGLLPPGCGGVVAAAAFVGSTADSFLGATLEAKGLMDNEAVNFSNTLVGALAGIGLAALTSTAL
jgi:uncharacterized protein (TIGR00297 family)